MGILQYLLLGLFLIRCKCLAADDSDKLWILFDNANLFECSGVTNQFTINKNDIAVTDSSGKPAYYLECPNTYTIEFKNMKAKKALPNLSGDIASTIQVPLLTGPAGLELDYPYQAIPQKHLIGGSTCDNVSGVITDNTENRDYCRYCDICQTSSYVENGLDKTLKHKYIGSVDAKDSFSSVCNRIDASQTYNLKRQVNCPGKKELEAQANQNIKPGLDTTLGQKLKVGKGKLRVFLSLLSSTSAPADANKWYANKKGCECCAKDKIGQSNCKPNIFKQWGSKFTGGAFPGGDNPCLKCNNDYVNSCVTGQPSKVGCFRVEYNFRVTDQRSDVEQFKQQIDYNNKVRQGNPWQSGGGTSGTAVPSCDSCSQSKCLAAITVAQTRSYCTSWWKTPSAKKFCCSKCPTVCSA